MDIPQVFARNLRRLRAEKGWTQQQLADRTEIDRAYLSALERAAYSATVDMIAKIAGAFDVEPASMLKR